MLTVRRPCINRSHTSPPQYSRSQAQILSTQPPPRTLTPPTSPSKAPTSSDSLNSPQPLGKPPPIMSSTGSSAALGPDVPTVANPPADHLVDGILICPFDVDYLENERGQKQMLGYGAWSNVYKALPRSQPPAKQGLLTPPSSPIMSKPVIVAVKTTARADAGPILRNEAKVLTYLHGLIECKSYVAPFFGVTPNNSLILEAIPTSLESYIRQCATNARENFCSGSINVPVVGSSTIWLDLARKLVSTLTWLHDKAGVVHGDIKPGNFLLRQTGTLGEGLPFQPLLIDFSSSHRTNVADGEAPTGTLSAVTREYTAPELLSIAVLSDPRSTATKASDVFSMAVTLLVAATGDTMVYSGSVFQRQAMATQGWQVLDFARGGEQGHRIPRHGVVSRSLEKAVLKVDMGRIMASEWLELVQET